MSTINQYFKTKKFNAIQQSFLRQCNKTTECTELQTELDCNTDDAWAEQKSVYENKIIALETDKKNISHKYDQLKAKYVQLLQVLLQLEAKNQKLELLQATEKTSTPMINEVQLQVSSIVQKILPIQITVLSHLYV